MEERGRKRMKKTTIKKIAISVLLALAMILTAYAHSGRTDSNGGHKDNKNVSGLGSYHYHCGGYPAHLHPNGVCPYTSNNTSTSKPASKPATQPGKTPAAGDSLGNVLYSDITAYINGYSIPVSNIEGYAHISVEDLQHYGFDVVWNEKDNTLKVERNKSKAIQALPAEKIPNGKKPGDIKEKYVSSDVKVYLSGELIDSYSTNGHMFMNFELLKKYGTVTWENSTRKLNCKLK